MKLTAEERRCCEMHSKLSGRTKRFGCGSCPLVVDERFCICYANIDGRTAEAKALRRYGSESKH